MPLLEHLAELRRRLFIAALTIVIAAIVGWVFYEPIISALQQPMGRLLTLVPWLLDHQGIPVEEAAATFGVTSAQMEADLSLLFVCGTPGHLPDDLIDADWEDGRIFLSNAESLARPWRFTLDEALTLMVGLRALSQVGGLAGAGTDRDGSLADGATGAGGGDAVERALAKLEAAAGAVASSESARVSVSIADDAAGAALATVSEALRSGRRVHLSYLVPSRDETTERDVDPMRLVSIESRWYLEGWCHRAEAVRLFRVDRIVAATVLDAAGAKPKQVVGRDLTAGLFVPDPTDLDVVIETGPDAAWVAEYYPTQSVTELEGGFRRLVLRTGDPGWVARLVWRLGGSARVVEPADLARSVRDGAREALAAYDALGQQA